MQTIYEILKVTRRLPTGRILVLDRIRSDVSIGVDSALQTNRIALDISPYSWIVVAEPVLGEAALAVEVLAGEAQVRERRESLLLGPAEGARHDVPGKVLACIGRLLRRVEMIGVDEIEVAAGD